MYNQSFVESDGLDFLNKPADFLPVLFPFVPFEVLFVLLMLVQLDDIVFGDFNVDDFPLAEKGIHDSQVPLVLAGLEGVVLAELLF